MKKLAFAALVLFGVAAIVLALLPRLVSSEAVRSALIERAREITGREMQFSGTPRIKFSPYLGIEIENVVFQGETGAESAPPILRMPVLASKLDVTAALRGSVQLSEFEFVRPEFNLTVLQDGSTNWTFPEGRMWQVLDQARSARAAAASGTAPDLSAVGNVSLGKFRISDGVVRLENRASGRSETVTSLDGILTWSSIRSPLTFSGNAIWRGEEINGNLRIGVPIMLIAGGVSPLVADLQSAPVSVTFNGEANRLSDFFVSGQARFQTQSLRRMVTFLGGAVGPGAGFEQFSVGGTLSGTLKDLQIPNATLTLDGNNFAGGLRFSNVDQNRAKLSGTLAAETLNLGPYASLAMDPQNRQTVFELLDQADADIRISATTVTAGAISASEFAGGLIARNHELVIDVGNASYGGGILAGSLTAQNAGGAATLKISMDASGVIPSTIPYFNRQTRLVPDGPSDIGVRLMTALPADTSQENGPARHLNGSLSIKMASGRISGLDFSEIIRSITSSGTPGDGVVIATPQASTSVSQFRLNASINDGTAWIQDSGFVVGEHEARLSGRASLATGSVAIWGGLKDAANPDTTPARGQFFIGGTIDQPLLVPQWRPENRNQEPVPNTADGEGNSDAAPQAPRLLQ